MPECYFCLCWGGLFNMPFVVGYLLGQQKHHSLVR